MANKTPKFTLKSLQTPAELLELVRYLNKVVKGSELVAALNAHKEEADPHPVYLTESEGDARYESLPIGTVMLWPSPVPPEKFTLANGAEMSRESALFGVCGINYGAGDGVTTFNIPNIPPIDAE